MNLILSVLTLYTVVMSYVDRWVVSMNIFKSVGCLAEKYLIIWVVWWNMLFLSNKIFQECKYLIGFPCLSLVAYLSVTLLEVEDKGVSVTMKLNLWSEWLQKGVWIIPSVRDFVVSLNSPLKKQKLLPFSRFWRTLVAIFIFLMLVTSGLGIHLM